MKVLVLGGTGMLGHKLVQVLARRFDVKYTLRGAFDSLEQLQIFKREDAIEHVDVSDLVSVRRAIQSSQPDVIVNAVGVIKHLPGAGDVEQTLSVNSIFPHRLARLSNEFGARLITMSTDCVFAGTRGMYSETDKPDALDLYGQSKHWGEVSKDNCLTIRTSIIGREIGSRHGLVEWLFSQRKGTVEGYTKAIFSGFPTVVFADIIIDIIERHPDLHGVFHISSEPLHKYGILKMIDRQFGIGVKISKNHDVVMDRSLDSSKFRSLTGFSPPKWEEMIKRMASDDTPYGKWNDQ